MIVKQKIYNSIKGREKESWTELTCDPKIKRMYFISTYGRIKNLKGKILKPDTDKDGYLKFTLQSIDGKKLKRFSHRLVALQFIDNPYNKPEVNHIRVRKKNDIPICPHDDNYYGNLEWVTRAENISHSVKNKLEIVKTCEDSGSSKFDNDTVAFICLMLEANKSVKQIIKMFGVSKSDKKLYNQYYGLIRHVKSRKHWKEVSKFYNF